MVTLDQAGHSPGEVRALASTTCIGQYVECLSLQRPARGSEVTRLWRIVADDAPHIMLQCSRGDDGLRHRVLVVGSRRTFTDIDLSRRALTLVARLRPGALSSLFGVSAHELTDLGAPIEELVGPRLGGAVDRMVTEAVESPFEAMEKFIMTLSERAEPIDPRARVIASLLSDPQASVAGVATSVGLSARGLRGFVSRMAGMSPKRFVRIRRLHRALAAGLPNPRTGWSMPALSAGFVDQSHLVHDCKALLGESPTRFARRRLA